MATVILGGGLAGLSLASLLKDESVILEAESRPGGLCRSFELDGVHYDIGPHIIFSKDQAALDFLTGLAATQKICRSNKIFHKGRFIKYPFENELSALEPAERDYCLKGFLNNPDRQRPAQNMLEYYRKIFGAGIVELYLQPYNEKIWKFDPALMDLQMVERIPRPPDADIIRSAKGENTEGYLHQLYFNYPETGGICSLISGLAARLGGKCKIHTGARIQKILRTPLGWRVETASGVLAAQRLVNCMPLHELFKYLDAPPDIISALHALQYNSIHIVALHYKKDAIGSNFAVNFADKSIIFHRLSKLGFLGANYRPAEGSVLLAEITFRPGVFPAELKSEEIKPAVCDGLHRLGLADRDDLLSWQLRTFKYAYVIYDLSHRKNARQILEYLHNCGIDCCGRFAEFEYLNMDAVACRSMNLAAKLNG
jgi:protoporphyrinogen oxidase